MSDTQPSELADFVEARKAYREKLEALEFPAYADVVGQTHSTTELKQKLKELVSDQQKGVHQQALDLITGSVRALSLRKKGFLGYVEDSKNSRPSADEYEANRLDKFNKGMI